MTEINLKVLELINENKSLKEISSILNITEKQLFIRIKNLINYGYNMDTTYHYNSDIFYNVIKGTNINNNKKTNIIMPSNVNTFKCLVISDLHIGEENADIKLADEVYNYAIKKGINIIINCGDIIEGDYTSDRKIINNFCDQVDYFTQKYPYDKNITNFILLGNHDRHSLTNDGFDVARCISNSRYDMVPIGYGNGNIKIKNDNILLYHKLHEGFKPKIEPGNKLLLSGHGHMMRTKIRDILWLGVPTLSYKSNDKTKKVLPGFIELDISLEHDKFEYIEAKHLVLAPDIIEMSETRCRVKNLFKENKRM